MMTLPKLCCGGPEESSETRTPGFQRFSCGVGHVLNDVIRQLLFSFRLVFFMRVLGLSAANAGWLTLLGLLLLAFLSPFCAFLVDRINIPFLSKKLGKRKSWHLIGIILGAVVIPLYFSSCFACQGKQWQLMLYVGILNVFLALAVSFVEISHLSLISAVAKDQSEAVELNALRTGFTFASGIITFFVAWAILGQDSKEHLSPESSMDFTVMTVILVGIALVFCVIFQIGTKEPSDDLSLKRKLSTSVAEFMRKSSFIPSNGLLQSMMYMAVEKAGQQHKERMCNRFVDSLKSKEEPNAIQATGNDDSNVRTRTFSMGFINALFSADEGDSKSKQELPSGGKVQEEEATKRLEIEGYVSSKAGNEDDEGMFRDVRTLPQERKISLLVSIFDKLVGSSDDQNQHLPTVPERTKDIEVTIGSDAERNCAEVSSTSSSNEDCTSFNEEEIKKAHVEDSQDEVNVERSSQHSSSRPTTISVLENKGFECNEAGLNPCSLHSCTVSNVDKADDREVKSKSLEIDSEENGDTPKPNIMSVRAWLKNPHLYKVAIIYTCAKVLRDVSYSYLPLFLTDTLKFGKEAIAYLPLVVLISAIVSTAISRKLVERIGTKWSFIFAALLVIGASLWFYFITQSTRVLTYPAAALLGFGLSAMFVNALSFAAELIGDNKGTAGFVFAIMGVMSALTAGVVINVVQNLFPEGSASEDCEACGNYVRHVFSIVPGSLALISLLIVLLFQSSKPTCKGKASKTDATLESDETT